MNLHIEIAHTLRVGGCALFLGLGACSSDSDTARAGLGAGSPESTRLAELYAALDAGLPEAAATLLDQVGESIGVAAPLLRARIALLEGDGLAALKHVESAKQLDLEGSRHSDQGPDARVLATEVEIYVALNRVTAAGELLRDAYKLVGRTAELERARGVVLLGKPGGGAKGLEALQTALELDPALPFVGFPMAQAQHLAGRAALGNQAPEAALAHALEARSFDPLRASFRELEAEARTALGDLGGAVELYADLAAEGRDVGSTLGMMHKNWGTRLLLEQRRAEALVQYCAARDLGFELGAFADGVLVDAATERIEEGAALAADSDWAGATEQFRAALDLDPRSPEAWNHLGVCLFREGDYYGAGEVWEEVLRIAKEDSIVLPEPVHLNLARAWRMADEPARAARALSDFLDGLGDGSSPWAEETRDLLMRLESENLRQE